MLIPLKALFRGNGGNLSGFHVLLLSVLSGQSDKPLVLMDAGETLSRIFNTPEVNNEGY